MAATNPSVPWAAKIQYLRQPASYPCRPDAVETRETHMSWVFLAGQLAYKLKKPKQAGYDGRSLDARRADCDREVQLNQRLAASVYEGVVPLVSDANGNLCLEGDGRPVEWLVKMRRLPESLMLDRQIEEQRVETCELRPAVEMLCHFYRKAPAFQISASDYRKLLTESLQQSGRELVLARYGQSRSLVHRVHERLRGYLSKVSTFDDRVQAGHVIDAHGDLRPEHICLDSPPVIIDCLQFDQQLRILDTASELSFLTLECERLGAGFLTSAIWSVYETICRDRPPLHLLQFYKAYHACLRAMVSAWHLHDNVPDPNNWTAKAHEYLRMADRVDF